MSFQALGKTVREFKGFDTFPAPSCTEICLVSDEVTAVCPVTGQPDQYTVRICYTPTQLCLESKSLKLYFQSLRNAGIFCEALSAQIAADIHAALAPQSIIVTVTQKPRGGISIIAKTEL